MSFRDLAIRTQLRLYELIHACRGVEQARNDHLVLEKLEGRILLSAAPLAAVIATAPDPVAAHVRYVDSGTEHADSPTTGTVAAFELTNQETTAAANVVAAAGLEIVFVDETANDYEELLADLRKNPDRSFQVFVLNAARDGIEQISNVLADYDEVTAVHIVSHGTKGAVKLGTGRLDADSIAACAPMIGGWQGSLSADADLLFYGCGLAGNQAGQALVDSLSRLTGADVAASVDDTGHAELGGDWELEYTVGAVDADMAFSVTAQQNWRGRLAVINVTTTLDDIGDGGDTSSVSSLIATPGSNGISLREAIIANNNDSAGNATINLAAGTYTLSIAGAGEEAAATGDLDVNKDVTIVGADASTTVIDAAGFGATPDRVFHLRSGITSLSGVSIIGGSTTQGGAFNLGGSTTLNLTDSELRGNSASNNGGAIYSLGTVNLQRVTVSGNTAGSEGGGIQFGVSSGGDLTNVTMSGNSANRGGAIKTNSVITITNSTIAFNSGSAGAGGIQILGSGDAVLKNTILASNTGGNANNTLSSLGGNIDSANDAGLSQPSDLIHTDPLIAPVLAYNGGPTATHALLSGSPAINAGETTGAPTLDQRGEVRDASPDIGAYELTGIGSPVLHNTFDVDASDSSGNAYHGTLTNGSVIDTTGGTNKIGGGKLSLDGTNDFVELSTHVAAFQSVSEGTIAAWVYVDSTLDTDVIFEASDSGDAQSRIALIADDQLLRFFVVEGGSVRIDVETSSALGPVNTWTHVAVTVDASGNKLYVNGSQVAGGGLTYFTGSAATTSFFDDVTNLDFAAWGIHKFSGSFGEQFEGLIDDGRIYDRALSASDISELHMSSNTPPTVASPIPNQAATEDSPLSFQFALATFSDVDGDPLTYTATLSDSSSLPTWLTFNAAARTFSGTPLNADVGTITVRVTADDGNLGTVFDDFDIVVSNTNDSPTVTSPIPNQPATEDSPFSFQFALGTFSDVDGDPLTYSATLSDSSPLPTWLTFNAATRTFSGTPLNADVGTIIVRVTADDGNLGSVFDDFDIVVSNTNDAPTVASPIPNQTATEDSPFSFQFALGTFDDVDGDPLTYSATLSDSSPLPTWLSFNAATRTFSGTPLNADVGTITVRVTADDGNLGTVFDDFDIVVSNTNDAPTVASPIPNQAGTEDSPFSFQFALGTFDDVDGDPLTYSATLSDASPLPTWLSFNAATRTFSGTPLNTDVGTITVRVTAGDGNLGTVFDDFDIVVSNTNDAPTVASPIPNQTATEDSPFSFQFALGTFDDVDGDPLTYSATLSDSSPLPTWLTFNAATRTFSGTPLNTDVDTITVRVTADDGNLGTVFDDFDLVVSNTNDAPTVASPIPNQAATEDSPFSFQFALGTFSDVDGDTLTYTATLSDSSPLPTWLTFNAATRTFSGTPLNTDVGTIIVRVTADDGNLGTVFDDFDIVVSNTNDPPTVATPIPNQAATEDSPFSFQFALGTFDDVDGDPLTYSATLSDSSPLPTWLSFNAATRTFSGTPLNADVGTIIVRVTADDGNLGTVFDDFDIVVSNTNDAPTVASPIPNQPATEDSPFSFQFALGTFGDVDGDPLTYSATLSDSSPLPTWLTFNAATRAFSGTPLNANLGTITVRVTADDGNLGTVFDDFDIVVSNTNDAPTVASPIPNQAATEDSPFSFQFALGTFDDVDGDPLTYSATLSDSSPLPTWLSFNAATRTFSGTPLNADVGTIIVRVTADDGNLGTVFDDFDIVVSNTNDAPTVASPIPNQAGTEDSPFSFQFALGTFDDVDGDPLTYSATLSDASPLPTWLSFNAATRTFSGTPLNTDVGTITVRVTAGDGNLGTVFDDFDIVVSNSNAPPTVANPIPNQAATEDSPFIFQFALGTFSDVDGDPLTYSATLSDSSPLPTWLTFNAATRTFSGTPLNADVGTINVRVTVDDGNLGTVFDDFDIVVINTNDAPTDISLDNTSVSENSDGAVVGTLGLVDPDVGDTHWWTVGDARFEVVGGTLKLKSGQSLDHETEPTVSLDVKVVDQGGTGLSYAEVFMISVTDANDAPVAFDDNHSGMNEGATHSRGAPGVLSNDKDEDGDLLSAILVTGPSLSVSFTLNADGSYLYRHDGSETTTDFFTYRVSDGTSLSDLATVTLNINPRNDAPSDITLDNTTIPENSDAAVIGNLTVVDPDAGDTHSWDVDDTRFEITGTVLALRAGQSLDHEAEPVVNLVVTATDQGGTGVAFSKTFAIAVSDVHEAPENILLDNLSVSENVDGAVVGNLTVVDPDVGDTHGWTLDDARFEVVGGTLKLKTGQSFDHETEPTVALNISVTDQGGAGLTHSQSFIIAVDNVNDAPAVANPIADQTATEDSPFSFQFAANTFDDVDGDTLSYSATLSDTSPLPGWLSFNAATRTFSGTPLNADVGTITVRVTADDGNFGTVFDDFDIVIGNINDAPTVANPIADQAATQDSPFSFQFAANTFDDVDGDMLSYTAALSDTSPLPGWLSFNAATRTFSGTPLNADVGTITVRVTADDGNLGTVFDDFDIVIGNINDAPTVANPIADQAATQDSPFSFQFAANTFDDVDGDMLSYTATLSDTSPLPGWLSFNAATRTFSGTPLNADVGTITVRVTADDGNPGAVFDDFDIVISNTNDAPTVANPIADQTATEDSPFSFQFVNNTFDDVDGDTLTYTATLSDASPLPGWLSFNAATRAFSGTPLNAVVGTITVRVTADDGNLGTVFDDFDIVISNTNDAPTVATPMADQTATEDSPFSFRFAANTFDDVDGDMLSYTATLSDTSPLPGWLSFNAATRTFSGTPLNADVGTITLRVTADDGNLGTVFDDFDIVIANTNDAPAVANLIPDQAATEDSPFSFQFASNTFNDVDGDTLTYTTTLSDASPLPAWLSFNATTRTFSGTPLNADVGTITVRVTADDGNLESVFDDFILSVANTNDAPLAITLDNKSISENADGVIVGTLGVIDPDAGDTHTLRVDDARFEVVATQLKLKPGQVLDRESEPAVTLTITATDLGGTGLVFKQAFVIKVTDVNEAPTVALSPVITTLDEDFDPAVATVVATITVKDDALGLNTLSLSGDDAGAFEIVGNDLRLVSGTELDFETKAVLRVTLNVDDATLPGSPETFATHTITVNDINEAPTLSLTPLVLTIPESADLTSSRIVAMIVVHDDASGTNVVTLTGEDAALFELRAGNTELHLKSDVPLDFESNPSLDVLVAVDDPSLAGKPGHIVSATIAVGDTDELPPAPPSPKADLPGETAEKPSEDSEEEESELSLGAENNRLMAESDSTSGISRSTANSSDGDVMLVSAFAASMEEQEPDPAFPKELAAGHWSQLAGSLQLRQPLRGVAGLNPLVSSAIQTFEFTLSIQVWHDLNEVSQQFESKVGLEHLAVGSVFTVSTGLTVGYVLWVIRGGLLVSSLMAHMPAWRLIDPMVVLQYAHELDEDEEDDSLASIVQGSPSSPNDQDDPSES